MTCTKIISVFYSFLNVVLTAKQNQKFPFHFLSAPPTPPAELNQKGRKIFEFCPRESASASEAQSERTIKFQATTHAERAKLGILLEMGSDFFKQTPLATKTPPSLGGVLVASGPERIRTPRLLSASEALYQMSYGPKKYKEYYNLFSNKNKQKF